VDDLQDFASIEAGHFSVVRAPHAPASIAREAIESFQPMAEDNGVRLTSSFAQGSLAIYVVIEREIRRRAARQPADRPLAAGPGGLTLAWNSPYLCWMASCCSC
jgi:signal transduction histidine kinase